MSWYRPGSRSFALPPSRAKPSRKKLLMKWGWSRRALAFSISSRTDWTLRGVERVGTERPLGEQRLERGPVERRVDDLVHPGADLGRVGGADRLDEQVAQALLAAEGQAPEDVEDAAAEVLGLGLELREQERS